MVHPQHFAFTSCRLVQWCLSLSSFNIYLVPFSKYMYCSGFDVHTYFVHSLHFAFTSLYFAQWVQWCLSQCFCVYIYEYLYIHTYNIYMYITYVLSHFWSVCVILDFMYIHFISTSSTLPSLRAEESSGVWVCDFFKIYSVPFHKYIYCPEFHIFLDCLYMYMLSTRGTLPSLRADESCGVWVWVVFYNTQIPSS